MCKNLEYVYVMSTKAKLQKCITWPKKFGKGRQKWNKACVETNIRPRKN